MSSKVIAKIFKHITQSLFAVSAVEYNLTKTLLVFYNSTIDNIYFLFQGQNDCFNYAKKNCTLIEFIFLLHMTCDTPYLF